MSSSDDVSLGKGLDVGGRESQDLSVDVVVVLTIGGRSSADHATLMSWSLRHFEGDVLDRPGPDLALRQFDEPFEVLQLRIVVDPVRRCLAHTSPDAGSL